MTRGTEEYYFSIPDDLSDEVAEVRLVEWRDLAAQVLERTGHDMESGVAL